MSMPEDQIVKRLLEAHNLLIERTKLVAQAFENVAMPLLKGVYHRAFFFVDDEVHVVVEIQPPPQGMRSWTYVFPVRFLWEKTWEQEVRDFQKSKT